MERSWAGGPALERSKCWK